MPKQRPLEIHANSLGKKHLKLQEIIHSDTGYYFIVLTGNRKTDFYNKGIIDGSKTNITLFETFEAVYEESSAQVIAFPREPFSSVSYKGLLIGKIPLDKTFLITTKEAGSFITEYCWNCDGCGIPNCFREIEIDCGKEDRERYLEPSWFAVQKEKAQERKARKRTAFPA